MPELRPPYYEQDESLKAIKAEHVVYLAIFNADRFRTKIESWLPALNLDGTHLVIGDNCSSDTSLSWLIRLVESIDVKSTIIRNEKNYGGYGGFAINLHRFPETKWFTTLHQDDRYRADHVQKHREVLRTKHSNLGMICSEFESVLPDGKKVAYPRAYWFLSQSSDPATIFLANLKNHAYPFSGATFSREIFEKFPIPWHSSAFPDTEIVLKMCGEYSVTFAEGLTVEYLENPSSESHSLTPAQREFGSFQALIRVFTHKNFAQVCNSVSLPNQTKFIEGLIDGISVRFRDNQLRSLMTQVALEQSAEHLGLTPDLARELAKGYMSVQDTRAVDVLGAIGGFSTNEMKSELVSPATSNSNMTSNTLNSIWFKFFGYLPLKIRKSAFRLLMKSSSAKSRMKAWDFDWEKN